MSSLSRLGVVIGLLLVVGMASGTPDSEVAISAPDIYPDDSNPFVGDVLVKMVANQPSADVYYTKDGTKPSNTSKRYSEPFRIFEIGTFRVRAVAIARSGVLANSGVTERSYVIVKSDVEPPLVSPAKGVYRGRVDVSMHCPQTGGKLQCCGCQRSWQHLA